MECSENISDHNLLRLKDQSRLEVQEFQVEKRNHPKMIILMIAHKRDDIQGKIS